VYPFVILLLGFVIFLGVLNDKKTPRITTIVLLAFLWIMMAANIDNPDYDNYYLGYQNLQTYAGSEWGYYVLAKVCTAVGMSYNQFKFILSAIGLLLIHSTVIKYLKNHIIFYIIYFICPFMMDVTQLKNFIAMSFLIYAIPFLTEETIKGKMKYAIFVTLGAAFQITAFIYLPIMFLGKVDKNKMTKIVLTIAAIASIIIGLNRGLVVNLITLLSSLFGGYDGRISVYSNVGTRYGFLIYWGIQIISFLLIKWAKHVYVMRDRALSAENVTNIDENQEYKLIQLSETINTYAFIFLPFYVVQLTYGRFLRNLLPLNFIVLIIVYRKNIIAKGKITSKGLLTLLFLISYVVVNFYFMIYMEYSETIVEPLFTGNWFFNMNWSAWFN
jgi:hypothetical protein